MIYFIVFGDTSGQLFGSFGGQELEAVWYSSRYFYVLILGAVLTPVVIKKELAELEWLSIVLFVSIGLFILVNLWELTIDPKFVPIDSTAKEYYSPKVTYQLISSFSIVLVAYSYQQNVFPVYSSLQVKTNEQYKRVSLGGLVLTLIIYCTVGMICLFMFGNQIESSVLLNIGSYHPNNVNFW